jgi:hypothetical protein
MGIQENFYIKHEIKGKIYLIDKQRNFSLKNENQIIEYICNMLNVITIENQLNKNVRIQLHYCLLYNKNKEIIGIGLFIAEKYIAKLLKLFILQAVDNV